MVIPIYTYRQYQKRQSTSSIGDYSNEREQVLKIIEEVRSKGDTALKKYTLQFDQADLDQLKVGAEEQKKAASSVSEELIEAIKGAKKNITRFHSHQLENSWWDNGPGWIAGQRYLPLQSVGAYIPGGTAAYPSSVLMTVIPAKVAGVKNVYLCTPPGSDGKINPVTLAAAAEAGASAVYKIGGAQAVAALAYGTESVPAVQKIVGPGNIYVTLAKKEVFGRVGIDMLAGPSEIVIVADEYADPAYLAADLLSQAEHDPLSRSILITPDQDLAQQVVNYLEEQIMTLPRKKIAEQSLQEQGAIIIVSGLDEAWSAVNEIAPEHLELQLENAWPCLDYIDSAGAVFIGPYSPESLGDYWAGSNHVLPTAGAARYASALGVSDFIKRSHVLCYTSEALNQSASQIAALARAEGLEAHARAVLLRRRKNEPQG